MQYDCNYIVFEELAGMSNKELIQRLRNCEKLNPSLREELNPLREELNRRRDLANSSCLI